MQMTVTRCHISQCQSLHHRLNGLVVMDWSVIIHLLSANVKALHEWSYLRANQSVCVIYTQCMEIMHGYIRGSMFAINNRGGFFCLFFSERKTGCLLSVCGSLTLLFFVVVILYPPLHQAFRAGAALSYSLSSGGRQPQVLPDGQPGVRHALCSHQPLPAGGAAMQRVWDEADWAGASDQRSREQRVSLK